jgi:hypothetical protein
MRTKSAFTWIEVFLLIIIFAIVASFVLRFLFAREIREAEDRFFGSLGIGNDFQFVFKMCVAIAAFALMAVRSRNSKKS